MPASKAQQAITAERRARALALRVAGVSYEQIAAQLGYASRGAAFTDIDRAYQQRQRDLADQAGVATAVHLEELDAARRLAWTIARRQHILVSQGRVMTDAAGQPMVDDMPTLAALDRIIKIQEREARLTGRDAPTKVTAEVRNVDALDAEIEQLVARLAAGGQGTPALAAEG